jgi:hypothetical protein
VPLYCAVQGAAAAAAHLCVSTALLANNGGVHWACKIASYDDYDDSDSRESTAHAQKRGPHTRTGAELQRDMLRQKRRFGNATIHVSYVLTHNTNFCAVEQSFH